MNGSNSTLIAIVIGKNAKNRKAYTLNLSPEKFCYKNSAFFPICQFIFFKFITPERKSPLRKNNKQEQRINLL